MSTRCIVLAAVGVLVAVVLSVWLRGSLHAPGNAGPGAQRPDPPARAVETAQPHEQPRLPSE